VGRGGTNWKMAEENKYHFIVRILQEKGPSRFLFYMWVGGNFLTKGKWKPRNPDDFVIFMGSAMLSQYWGEKGGLCGGNREEKDTSVRERWLSILRGNDGENLSQGRGGQNQKKERGSVGEGKEWSPRAADSNKLNTGEGKNGKLEMYFIWKKLSVVSRFFPDTCKKWGGERGSRREGDGRAS